jgi:hypothetical protein
MFFVVDKKTKLSKTNIIIFFKIYSSMIYYLIFYLTRSTGQ